MGSSAENSPASRMTWRRQLYRLTVGVAITYLTICGIMWFLENKLVFRPTTFAEGWNEPPDPAISEVEFTSSFGNQIHAWWMPGDPSKPTFLICTGNGGNLSGRGPLLIRMKQLFGCSALIFDYPGYGKSSGKPSEKACYDAAEAAIAWLQREKSIATKDIIFYGESLGGGTATEMAHRHDCKGLVLVKTFTSLPDAAKRLFPLLPVKWVMSNRFNSIAKIRDIHCPVFVTAATADRVVAYDLGRSLFEAANEPKEFLQDVGHDHNDKLPDEFWSRMGAFFAILK